jgi:hypothetical protein
VQFVIETRRRMLPRKLKNNQKQTTSRQQTNRSRQNHHEDPNHQGRVAMGASPEFDSSEHGFSDHPTLTTSLSKPRLTLGETIVGQSSPHPLYMDKGTSLRQSLDRLKLFPVIIFD